ncbi:MAG: hypothetical protein PHY80_04540, partial [Rickettsiales bacterium]|nr:hypothetical protein [Rickettsiales bacterium]
MNKNNNLFLLSKVFIFLTWRAFFSLGFSAFATETDGVYLPYDSSCSTNWSNYPATPTSISHTCLKKRYCSDIKYDIIRTNGFDRCRNDSSCGADNDVKYEIESETEENITTSNPCSPAEANGVLVETTTNNNITESAYKKIFKTVSGSKCEVVVKAPVIFAGITVRLADGTEAFNQNKPAVFYFQTGHNGVSSTNQNCMLKSCADLTGNELEAIDYSTNFPTDSNGNLVYDGSLSKDYDSILLYKFCEPHKYTGTVSMSNGTKVKYYDPNIVGYDQKYVYCHEYDDENLLQFLWKSGDSYDNANNYECVLHECPRVSGLSLSCSTNYDLFYKKTNSYLTQYEQYVLKNISSNPLSNPLRDKNCFQASSTCSISKYTTNLECTNGTTLRSECDNYVGLDKDFTDITDPIAYGLSLQTACTLSNGKYYCSKTYDCAVSKNEVCNDTENETTGTVDETLSYFYRPVPPLPATEICPDSNNSTCKVARVIIKRSLRGIVDYPLGEYQNPDDSGFGRWWQYRNEEGNDRIEGVKDYFQTNLSETNRDNICALNDSDFKNFENYRLIVKAFWISISFHYGKYYDGNLFMTKFWNLPHILPLCNKSSLGIKGAGREYMCGNSGYICNAPSWDSYYIKGYPTYEWKDNEANVSAVSATVCLRQKNSGELSVCGDRECRVDCAFGICATQWCGIDRCVTLTAKEGEDCNLKAVNDGYSSDCVKDVSTLIFSHVRFRLRMIDRRVYAFLDTNDLGCSLFSNYIGQMNEIRRNDESPDSYGTPGDNSSTIGGTFRGKLDQYSLFDDNNLVDYNCDGEITDKDVFGEYLFDIWNCQKLIDYEEDQNKPLEEQTIVQPVMANSDLWCYKDENEQTPKDRGEYHPYCKSYRINNGENPSAEFVGNSWITWDVVEYQGNNQQQNTGFCNVGHLEDCRGFYKYSKENNLQTDLFMRESQSFKMGLPLGPDYFYKYATIENSPDLFLPLLVVYSFRKYGDVSYTIYANADSDEIILDFFRPSIEMKYGDTVKQSTIDFNKIETTGDIDTLFGTPTETIETSYVFKKTNQLYPNPSARVCLYQILTSGNKQEIKCLKRRNPEIGNFVIKPYNVEIENPTVNAYFHDEDLAGVTTVLNLSDTNKFIPFYDNDDGIYEEENKNLPGLSFAYGQNFPIFLSLSYCSKLYYSCIFTQKEYDEKVVLSTTKEEELKGLKSKLTVCNETIDKYCKNQNGSEKIVQKKTDGSIIKVKKNNTADGAYNQICVSKGFEDYQTYVKALPYVDAVAGKCVLDNDSKQKSECRKVGYYEFCSIIGVDGCECLDGTSSCSCGSYGCIKEVDCSCSGTDCLTLPEACFLPGFNSELSSLDINGKPLNSCSCQLSTSSGSTGITIRKATPREMGLCSDLININFCDPIKYYNENKVYYDGGDGEVLSVIEDDYISNIWRTNQEVYGKYYISNFGHAEFDKANDCSGDLPSEFCLLSKRCYSDDPSTKGQVCLSTDGDHCKCSEYLQYGSCNGFWKEKYNTKPLARCKTTADKFNQTYGKFELVDGTGCERYSCPAITDNESPTADEILASVNATEDNINSINTEGKSNGFATWKKYKKGTFGMSSEDLDNELENGHGDDLEQRNALYCLQGYAPAGSNLAIKNYIPVINELGSKVLQTRIDVLAKNLIGYGIEKVTYDLYGNETLVATNDDILNYQEFATKIGYAARYHLPMRYCSQIG